MLLSEKGYKARRLPVCETYSAYKCYWCEGSRHAQTWSTTYTYVLLATIIIWSSLCGCVKFCGRLCTWWRFARCTQLVVGNIFCCTDFSFWIMFFQIKSLLGTGLRGFTACMSALWTQLVVGNLFCWCEYCFRIWMMIFWLKRLVGIRLGGFTACMSVQA